MLPIRYVAVFLFFAGFLSARSDADEGMFPISELEKLALKAKGLEMDPGDLFRVDGNCLVDGICRVNGCTGSFVSSWGLIITNHHCAYRGIQAASTAENDYLKNGFIAKSVKNEIPAEGYEVRITESYRDVSADVLSAVTPEMDSVERSKAISKRRKELEQSSEKENPGMRAEVAEMFAGRTYVLFLYTFIKDVRLVFAPPSSVGNFGGDVDNWEWPRHTGDFSFLRAYVAPDGSTATYSPDNVPFQPKRFIPVAPEGVSEGDFVFLLGYPGRTARHKTASFLTYEEKVRLPFVVEQYQWRINAMEAAGQDDRGVALKHTSTIKSLANVEKRSRGQLKGLKRAGIVATRQNQEAQLQSYIDADPARKQKYGYVLPEIDAVYEQMTEAAPYELNIEGLRSSSRMFGLAFLLLDAANERVKPDLERESAYMDRNFDRTRNRALMSFRDRHLPTDRVITLDMLRRLSGNPLAEALPNLGPAIKNSDAARSLVDSLYNGSTIDSPEDVNRLFEASPDELKSLDDPFIQLAVALYPEFTRLRELGKERSGKLGKLYGALIDVKQEFLKTNFVPDANGTLRLTLGRIRGYSPEDAVYKSPITTLKGVVDKTTGVEPFITPQEILDYRAAENFGRFAHPKLNDVPVAILYDTDTTGGNSGSPVINARENWSE